METISFEDFKKLDIRVGKILSAEKIDGSNKLLKLDVYFGTGETGEGINRQIVAGIAQFYEADELAGKEAVFAFNLAPRTLKGTESQGMILAASNGESPVLLTPDKEVLPGSMVK